MEDRSAAHRFILSEIVSLESVGGKLALTLRDEQGGSVRLDLPHALALALRDRLDDAAKDGDGGAESDPGSI